MLLPAFGTNGVWADYARITVIIGADDELLSDRVSQGTVDRGWHYAPTLAGSVLNSTPSVLNADLYHFPRIRASKDPPFGFPARIVFNSAISLVLLFSLAFKLSYKRQNGPLAIHGLSKSD